MIEALIFYPLAMMILATVAVVAFSRQPIQQICALIATFVLMSVLWLLLQAEFLALLLIFVYVGAVMTLFLYIVMMLNRDSLGPREISLFWMSYLGYIILAGIGLWLCYAFIPSHSAKSFSLPHAMGQSQSFSLKSMGVALFNEHWLAFETCGILLLVAMLSCILLVHRGLRKGHKKQVIREQVAVSKQERLTIIKDGDHL